MGVDQVEIKCTSKWKRFGFKDFKYLCSQTFAKLKYNYYEFSEKAQLEKLKFV